MSRANCYGDNLPRAIQRIDQQIRELTREAQILDRNPISYTEAAQVWGYVLAYKLALRILWEEVPSHGSYCRSVLEPGKKKPKKARPEAPKLRLAA